MPKSLFCFRDMSTLCAAISLFVILGAGCKTTQPTGPAVFPLPITETSAPTSTPAARLPDDMEIRTTTFSDGRTVHLAIVTLNTNKTSWSINNQPAKPKSVANWREQLHASLVVNGAYFSEDFRPSGYYHLPGATSTRISWPSNEAQHEVGGYSGMIQINEGKISLSYLPNSPQQKPATNTAVILSFPTLIASSTPMVREDSGKLGRRTLLAQDAKGTIYAIATQDGALTLYELAQWLAMQPEKFVTAINLDGGKSTGLSYEKNGIDFNILSVPVPNVISAIIK